MVGFGVLCDERSIPDRFNTRRIDITIWDGQSYVDRLVLLAARTRMYGIVDEQEMMIANLARPQTLPKSQRTLSKTTST